MFLQELEALIQIYEEDFEENRILENLAQAMILLSRRRDIDPEYSLAFLRRLCLLEHIHRRKIIQTKEGEDIYVADWPYDPPEA